MCPITCPNRSAEPNCHNTCEIYKADIERWNKNKELKAKDTSIENKLFHYERIICVPKDRRTLK